MLGNKIVPREHQCHEEEVQDVPRAWAVEAQLRSRGWGGGRFLGGMMLLCMEAPGLVTRVA